MIRTAGFGGLLQHKYSGTFRNPDASYWKSFRHLNSALGLHCFRFYWLPGSGFRIFTKHPDPREDLESRSPDLGPCTTKGTLQEPPLRDLLFGSSQGSGQRKLEGMTLNPKP